MSKAKAKYNLIHVEPAGYEYDEGNHRYGLEFKSKRAFNENKKSVAVIQMNGSITNWLNDDKNEWTPDPTIGKVLCWCSKYGFDVVHCLNTWSYVDRNPRNLRGLTNDTLNKSENDKWIKKICAKVDVVIVAYGNCKGIEPQVFRERKIQLLKLLDTFELYQVGEVTKKGNPKHGRGWNGNQKLQLFNTQ